MFVWLFGKAEWSVIWKEKDKKWRNIQIIGSLVLDLYKDKEGGNIQNIGRVVCDLEWER